MPKANATTNVLNTVTISAPATSPTLTVSGSTTTVSYSLSVTIPLDTAAVLSLDFQRSSDGGVNWNTFSECDLVGGPITKGINVGQQATDVISGEVDNLNVGDKLRVTAPVVSGSWTISASITQS